MTKTTTRTPLCANPLCPAPSDVDWHRCLVCESLAVEHAHVEGRGRNPSRRKDKTNIVPLCVLHHREVDERQNGTHGHAIRQIPGRGRLYFRFDLHGNTTFKKVLDPGDKTEQASVLELPGQQPSVLSPGGEGDLGEVPALADYQRPQDSPSPATGAGDGPHVGVDTAGGTPSPALPAEGRVHVAQLAEPWVGKGQPASHPGDAGPTPAVGLPSASIVTGGKDAPALPVSVSDPPVALVSGEEEASQHLHDLHEAGMTPDPRRVNAAPRPSSSPLSLESDWTDLDDDTLQQLYDEGEHRQQEGYLVKCKAVWQYRQNHVQAWGESWTEQAIERFGCSRPYAFAYANLWEIYLTIDTTLREGMASLTDSRSLMQAVGRKRLEDGVKLLEAAVAHAAEFGQPPTLAGLLRGAESAETEMHECPLCQLKHRVRLKEEWKA